MQNSAPGMDKLPAMAPAVEGLALLEKGRPNMIKAENWATDLHKSFKPEWIYKTKLTMSFFGKITLLPKHFL